MSIFKREKEGKNIKTEVKQNKIMQDEIVQNGDEKDERINRTQVLSSEQLMLESIRTLSQKIDSMDEKLVNIDRNNKQK